jgi:uncharacterized protein with von Willebrand factor type A (vWA) domain
MRRALLPGVDRAAFAVAFASRLRQRGLPVDFTRIDDLVRALAVSPPGSLPRLYWTARISLVRRASEIEVFDAVFAAVFGGGVPGRDPHMLRKPPAASATVDAFAGLGRSSIEDRNDAGLPWATLPAVVSDADGFDGTLSLPQRLPSDITGLADLPFERLDARQMETLGRWLETAVTDWPARRSRRRRVDHRGRRIALRATLERSRRTGWEPVELVRERALDRPRPVVMLCDVSRSMEAQATAYLHLMRALALAVDVEAFAFATTLTRLTAVLRHRSAEATVEQATAKVTDRFGGTRIATNLKTLLASHHGGKIRGAIVIIGSDGWDSDPPEDLASAMARLHRRAYRVLWMNPRAAAPGFEPCVASMAAALPYCDELLPADTFHSLGQVISAISDLR